MLYYNRFELFKNLRFETVFPTHRHTAWRYQLQKRWRCSMRWRSMAVTTVAYSWTNHLLYFCLKLRISSKKVKTIQTVQYKLMSVYRYNIGDISNFVAISNCENLKICKSWGFLVRMHVAVFFVSGMLIRYLYASRPWFWPFRRILRPSQKQAGNISRA